MLSSSCLQLYLLLILSLSWLVMSDDANSMACTLCQDGGRLPFPLRKVFPNSSCAALQIDANRGSSQMCVYYQGVVGTYCGCDNVVSNDICQICFRGFSLPRPDRVVNGLACIQHEFRASLYDNCTAHQELFGDECCFDDVPSATPTSSPTSVLSISPSIAATIPMPTSSSTTTRCSTAIILVVLLSLLWS
jgi:hypothetical protein